MTVSVALCTHNGQEFLRQQLESIFGQTVQPDEIVLSDDASTDTTVELATALLTESAIPFRLLRNERPLGVTRNFEQAILATTSTFIALSDQDDVWHPDRLERALAVFAAREPVQLVHANARLVDEDGAAIGATLFEALGVERAAIESIHGGGALSLLLRRNLVTGATTMFRRSLADTAMPFPPEWVHDEWLAVVAAIEGGVDVVEEPLIDYRQHGANQIGVAKLSVIGKFRRMVEPGADRNVRLLARAEALRSWLQGRGEASDTVLELAVDKAEHEAARSALPISRLSRIAPVIRELRTGRYSTFGRGPADAVRDLLQPLNRDG